MCRPIAALWALLLSAVCLPGSAWSALAGNALQLDYLYPTPGDSLASIVLVAPFADLPYTCCLGNEFSPAGSALLISVTDDSIVVAGDRSQVFTPADFNGLSFFDVFGTIDAISGAALVESTLPGLDAGDLDFSADRVLIDFAGASGLNLERWRVVVRLSFGEGSVAVPEPGGLALVALALIGLGVLGGATRSASPVRQIAR